MVKFIEIYVLTYYEQNTPYISPIYLYIPNEYAIQNKPHISLIYILYRIPLIN